MYICKLFVPEDTHPHPHQKINPCGLLANAEIPIGLSNHMAEGWFAVWVGDDSGARWSKHYIRRNSNPK